MRHALVLGAIAPILFSTLEPAAWADDRFWENPNGGVFESDRNWDVAIPDVDDVAVFDLNAFDVPILFSTSVFNQRLLIRRGRFIFDLGGGSYDLTETLLTTPPIVIGDTSGMFSELTLVNGPLRGRFIGVADAAGATGQLTLDGVQSEAIADDITHIGKRGFGTLDLRDGARLTSPSTEFGFGSAAIGLATVDNADLTADFRLVVGSGGTAMLALENDGAVFSGGARIGQQSESTGEVTVSGPGSIWMLSAGLDVGFAGNGRLEILDGGTVAATDFVSIGSSANGFPDTVFGEGDVRICGATSRLDIDGDLVVAPVGVGRVTLETGGYVTASGDLMAGLEASIVVVLDRDTSYEDPAFDFGGAIDDFELGIELADGYMPALGAAFHIFSAGASIGTITPQLPLLRNGLAWSLDQTTNDYILMVVRDADAPGDIDGDGLVNIEDLLAVLAAWGPCDGCPEDTNGDGVVAIDDLLAVLGDWT